MYIIIIYFNFLIILFFINLNIIIFNFNFLLNLNYFVIAKEFVIYCYLILILNYRFLIIITNFISKFYFNLSHLLYVKQLFLNLKLLIKNHSQFHIFKILLFFYLENYKEIQLKITIFFFISYKLFRILKYFFNI